MPSIPQSLLWISLVVLWLFVLVPMLISKRDNGPSHQRRGAGHARAQRRRPRRPAAAQARPRRRAPQRSALATQSRSRRRRRVRRRRRRHGAAQDDRAGGDRGVDGTRLPRRRHRRRGLRCAAGRRVGRPIPNSCSTSTWTTPRAKWRRPTRSTTSSRRSSPKTRSGSTTTRPPPSAPSPRWTSNPMTSTTWTSSRASTPIPTRTRHRLLRAGRARRHRTRLRVRRRLLGTGSGLGNRSAACRFDGAGPPQPLRVQAATAMSARKSSVPQERVDGDAALRSSPPRHRVA